MWDCQVCYSNHFYNLFISIEEVERLSLPFSFSIQRGLNDAVMMDKIDSIHLPPFLVAIHPSAISLHNKNWNMVTDCLEWPCFSQTSLRVWLLRQIRDNGGGGCSPLEVADGVSWSFSCQSLSFQNHNVVLIFKLFSTYFITVQSHVIRRWVV